MQTRERVGLGFLSGLVLIVRNFFTLKAYGRVESSFIFCVRVLDNL
jgi:hypothetical protein